MTGNLHVHVPMRRVRVTTVSRGKARSITCSECVYVALVIHHAMPMRRIILPSLD